jgi:hypothetical protein
MSDGKNMDSATKKTPTKWVSPINLLIVIAVFVVIGMVALGANLFMDRSIVQTVQQQDEQLFPRLSDNRAAVSSIVIERGGDRLELTRQEDGQWGLANWDGYPVDESKIAGLIDSFAALHGAPASTEKITAANVPDLRNQNTATAVTVRDRGGNALADLLIGDTVATPGGAEINRTYVQPGGEERAWLSAREIAVPIDLPAWTTSIILDISPDRITSARLRDAKGNSLGIERQENMEHPFKPTGLPEGARVSEAWQLTRMAGALEKLQIVEARKANDATLPPDADKVEAEFETLDGLRVKLAMVRQNDVNWAEIKAEADSVGDAKQEADAINARTAGWHFRLPDFATEGLVATTDAVIDRTSPRPAAPATAPATPPGTEQQAPRQ